MAETNVPPRRLWLAMHVYLFISEAQPSVRALTPDRTGENLPAEYAPWRAPNGGTGMFLGSVNDPITIAIRFSGYSLEISC
jgi:hypothetical protein